MKYIAVAIPFLVVLAACAPDRPANIASPTTATSAPNGKPLPKALPQGFKLHFPFSFREQTIVSVTPRDQRLRVTVEYAGGDAKDILASLAGSALEAGFPSGRWQQRSDGSIYFFAYKARYGQMRAEIRPASTVTADGGSKGTLVMGWPIERRTKPNL